MSKSIFIASAEPRSGKSVVVLGLMEALSRRSGRVGFFRPVVAGSPERDAALQLVAARYPLKRPLEALYGCDSAEARRLFQEGDYETLLKRILEKFQLLREEYDHIVCLGTDYTRIPSAFEFDFNADLANNLGCVVLPVVNGHGRTTLAIADALRVVVEALQKRKCDMLGVMVNRVPAQHVEPAELYLKEMLRDLELDLPVFLLPELPTLGLPTVGEAARELGAEWLNGEAEGRQREVANYKVAAMELPHFLERLEPMSLVITPGDRSDIIVGALAADGSGAFPQAAGLLLTGGLVPEPAVRRLIEGLDRRSFPILSVGQDTFATAVRVRDLEGAITPENPRKIAAALGLFERHVELEQLEQRIQVTRSTRVTPLMFENELIQKARRQRQHIVLPEGTEERVLRAAEIVTLRGVADLTLLGPVDEVRRMIRSLGLRLDQVPVVDPLRSGLRETFAESYFELRRHKGLPRDVAFDAVGDVSYFGTMMIQHGQADGMVSGAVHTTQHTIRPALEIIRTAPGCSIVSSVFFMCLPEGVLVYGDCAVNPDPNAEQLADIAITSADTARAFGIEPVVAMLSYSSGQSGKGADVDKVREATRMARDLRPGLKLEGPLQYDAAVDEEVARTKVPGSAVAGHATVFIFPDLNSGNNTYKAVQRSTDCVAVGPVLQGLRRPVNDLSRGATVPDIVNTIAITAIQAQLTREAV